MYRIGEVGCTYEPRHYFMFFVRSGAFRLHSWFEKWILVSNPARCHCVWHRCESYKIVPKIREVKNLYSSCSVCHNPKMRWEYLWWYILLFERCKNMPTKCLAYQVSCSKLQPEGMEWYRKSNGKRNQDFAVASKRWIRCQVEWIYSTWLTIEWQRWSFLYQFRVVVSKCSNLLVISYVEWNSYTLNKKFRVDTSHDSWALIWW